VEALSLVTEWAFRGYGIVRVQLVTHLDNERSQRVAERCGFREGVLRAWEPVKDEQADVVMWSRLVNDPAPDLGHR
jgi:RimJ/RimL family protein N-acetyltransferase